MKYTSVPSRRRAVPEGSHMRPVNWAAEIGFPINISAGTHGYDLLQGIRLGWSNSHQRIHRSIKEFAKREFMVDVETEVRLIPFAPNHFVSLAVELDRLRFRGFEAAGLEHVLAFARRYCRSASSHSMIPAFGSLELDATSDRADFSFFDEGENTLRTDRLYYQKISSDLSGYQVAVIPKAE